MITVTTKKNGVVVSVEHDPESARVIVRNTTERKEEKGRGAWRWLHIEALNGRLTVERLGKDFRPMIPRYSCDCLKEYDKLLAEIPFQANDQFFWSWRLHNAVNEKLRKPQVDMGTALSLWSEVDNSG